MTDLTLSHTARRTAEINERADAISALQPGEGVTVSLWSDCEAYTVVSRTATTMTLQEDKATLDPSFKPVFVAGGFAGHCTNQNEQRWFYEGDHMGAIIKISLRRWKDEEGNERRMWKRSGVGTFERGGSVILGRHKFHDYNF